MTKGLLGAVTTAIIIAVTFFCLLISIEKVPVGYEAVVYNMSGGVSGETLTQGWHIVAPTKRVKKFTVGNEQLILTKDEREGSKDDESFTVATSDDAMLAVSFQMTYRFKPDTLIETYKKFKGMDGEDIVNTRVRTVLKAKTSEVTTKYSMMDIYSGDRAKINNDITEYLNSEFGSAYGIEVIDASIIDVHPDKKLKQAIDNRVTAMQEKQQAKAEQETAKVKAETNLIEAQNKAEIKIMEAEAEAKANKLKADSITSDLIKMKEAEARLKHGWITVQGADAVVTN